MKHLTGASTPLLVVLSLAGVMTAVGCGATSSGTARSPSSTAQPIHATAGPDVRRLGSDLRYPLSPNEIAAGLIAGAHVPPAAREVPTAPTGSLARPPTAPAVEHFVERMRWWRISQPMAEVYAEVARHQSLSLAYAGSATVNGPSLSDRRKSADYTFRAIPQSVDSASFSIAVAPIDAHTSAIGAFATVVAQPSRSAGETVPTTASVGVAESPAASPRTVTGDAAPQIVLALNQLPVQPPGARSCPAAVGTDTATFRYTGHVLVATAGPCASVGVTLDDRSLTTLEATPQFTRDVMKALHGG